jgi:hypothetical protein
LNGKVAAPGLENRDYGLGDPLRGPRDTLYQLKLALTSLAGCGRSVGIVRLWTKTTELYIVANEEWRRSRANTKPSLKMFAIHSASESAGSKRRCVALQDIGTKQARTYSTIIVFLDIIHRLVFYLKRTTFGDWIPSPSPSSVGLVPISGHQHQHKIGYTYKPSTVYESYDQY